MDTDFQGVLFRLAEGNPGALIAMKEMLKANRLAAQIAIYHLDDLEIRGSLIWLCYKDILKHNAQQLIEKAMDHSIADELEKLPNVGYTRVHRV
jgi:hypothetical protein